MKKPFRFSFFIALKKKKLAFFILCTFFFLSSAFSQNPLVKQWDYRFGGIDEERLSSIHQTSDKGYILGGTSYSNIGGDKTENKWGAFGDNDYWIIKLDSSGAIQWDKDFGGIESDELTSAEQTADGGYILGGYSFSGISGNKSEANRDTTGITSDYWIIKTDSAGNIQWDKRFGGNKGDLLYSIHQTTDAGYILAGFSWSDAGGDKSQSSWNGSGDYWIVKTDALGNKQWDKRFGGTGGDQLYSIQQTTDGGYILGGFSLSGISGDKTQQNQGGSDYWIIKTDASGDEQWQKDFGGDRWDNLYSIIQSADGGFVLGGHSLSGLSGDKTDSNRDPSMTTSDYWVIKTDALGNKQWDKTFGGTLSEEFGSIIQTSDDGYIFSGTAYSGLNGDKTEINLGNEQSWYVKTDSIGSKQWDETLQTNSQPDDEAGLIIQTMDGCYVMANFTDAGQGGDKTQTSRGDFDYWVIKFCDSTFIQLAFTADQNLCPGTCNDFTNLSANATSFDWHFPGASPDTSTVINPRNICYSSPGSYDVILIASGPAGTDTLTMAGYITVFPQPPPQSIIQSGDTLFSLQNFSTYQWYHNGQIISGSTNYFHALTDSGDYNVVCTDSNGCEVEAVIYNVHIGVNELIFENGINIFPNPVCENLEIESWIPGVLKKITLFNMAGDKILSVPEFYPETGILKDKKHLNIDCHDLTSGVYIIEMYLGEKPVRMKFLKSALQD